MDDDISSGPQLVDMDLEAFGRQPHFDHVNLWVVYDDLPLI
jgi:hypothetical protein